LNQWDENIPECFFYRPIVFLKTRTPKIGRPAGMYGIYRRIATKKIIFPVISPGRRNS